MFYVLNGIMFILSIVLAFVDHSYALEVCTLYLFFVTLGSCIFAIKITKTKIFKILTILFTIVSHGWIVFWLISHVSDNVNILGFYALGWAGYLVILIPVFVVLLVWSLLMKNLKQENKKKRNLFEFLSFALLVIFIIAFVVDSLIFAGPTMIDSQYKIALVLLSPSVFIILSSFFSVFEKQSGRFVRSIGIIEFVSVALVIVVSCSLYQLSDTGLIFIRIASVINGVLLGALVTLRMLKNKDNRPSNKNLVEDQEE